MKCISSCCESFTKNISLLRVIRWGALATVVWSSCFLFTEFYFICLVSPLSTENVNVLSSSICVFLK